MQVFKRVIASIFLFPVFFAQAKGCCDPCKAGNKVDVYCKCANVSDLSKGLTAITMEVGLLSIKKFQEEKLLANLISLPIENLCLLGNECLSTIEPLAFGSLSSVKRLKIHNSPLGDKIWNLTENMAEITNLELQEVGLNIVPDKAFNNCKNITEILHNMNVITTFVALPILNLQTLNLENNKLSEKSFPLKFFQDVTITNLYLGENQNLTQLDETQFKDLLKNGTHIFVGRTNSNDTPYMQCVGADWLCEYLIEFIYSRPFNRLAMDRVNS